MCNVGYNDCIIFISKDMYCMFISMGWEIKIKNFLTSSRLLIKMHTKAKIIKNKLVLCNRV